jgi:hypothetical protein
MFNNKLGNTQYYSIITEYHSTIGVLDTSPNKSFSSILVATQHWSQSKDGQVITQWYPSIWRGCFLINVVGRSSIRSIGSSTSYAEMVTSSRRAKANISRRKVAVGIPTMSKSKVQMGKLIFLFSHQQGQGGRLHKWLKG